LSRLFFLPKCVFKYWLGEADSWARASEEDLHHLDLKEERKKRGKGCY